MVLGNGVTAFLLWYTQQGGCPIALVHTLRWVPHRCGTRSRMGASPLWYTQ
jgi:hypothetical protein